MTRPSLTALTPSFLVPAVACLSGLITVTAMLVGCGAGPAQESRSWSPTGGDPSSDVGNLSDGTGGGQTGRAQAPPAPTSPDPPDGARNVSIYTGSSISKLLDWPPCFRQTLADSASSYDVYFGTDPSPDSGEFQGTNSVDSEWWLPPNYLDFDTTYYWQVIATNDAGFTPGPIWSFTTETSRHDDDDGDDDDGYELLHDGVHEFTLQAAEAKRYGLAMDRGETAIVNASMPDDQTDVDVYAYAPGDNWPVASSDNGSGLPDNVTFVADTSGEYAVEMVNISSSRSAQFAVAVQRLPSNSASSSTLIGIDKIMESDGQPLSSSSSEWWVFADGNLASFYGWLGAEDFGLVHDLQYWVDAHTGAVTELHNGSIDFNARILQGDNTQAGTSLDLTIRIRWDFSDAGDSVVVDETYVFSGSITDGGQFLEGDVHSVVKADGDTVLDFTGTIRLRRD